MNEELYNGYDYSEHWVKIPEIEQLVAQLPTFIEKYGIEAILDKIPLSEIYEFMKSSQ